MNRDPSELRRRYAAKELAARNFMDALQKVLAGNDSVRDQLPKLLEEQAETHKNFTEEAQHFVHWKQLG